MVDIKAHDADKRRQLTQPPTYTAPQGLATAATDSPARVCPKAVAPSALTRALFDAFQHSVGPKGAHAGDAPRIAPALLKPPASRHG